MDRFPAEIKLMIISHLYDSIDGRLFLGDRPWFTRLASYAVISRAWQGVVEKFTFRHLTIKSADLASGKAGRILTPSRLDHVTTLNVMIGLRPHDLAAAGRSPDEDLSIAGGIVFTTVVKTLFEILHSAPSRQPASMEVHLRIQPRSPRDSPHTRENDTTEMDLVIQNKRDNVYVDLQLKEALPEVPMVSALRIGLLSHSLLIVPSAACRMAAAMPRLENLHVMLSDAEKKDAMLRIQLREGLAKGLETLPSSIKFFHFSHKRVLPRDQSYEPPSAVRNAAEGDLLSHALLRVFQREGLREFSVDASFDVSLLGTDAEPSRPGQWADLTSLVIGLHGITPSGQWMALADDTPADRPPIICPEHEYLPGEQREYVHRDRMDPDHVEPYLFAAGRAAKHMPALKFFKFNVYAHQFQMEGPRNLELEYDIEEEEFILECSPLYQPEEETLEVWHEVAALHRSEPKFAIIESHAFY